MSTIEHLTSWSCRTGNDEHTSSKMLQQTSLSDHGDTQLFFRFAIFTSYVKGCWRYCLYFCMPLFAYCKRDEPALRFVCAQYLSNNNCGTRVHFYKNRFALGDLAPLPSRNIDEECLPSTFGTSFLNSDKQI